MPDGTIFITFSFVIRVFDGTGGAMAMTAAVAFLAMCFPDNVGSVMVRFHFSIYLPVCVM